MAWFWRLCDARQASYVQKSMTGRNSNVTNSNLKQKEWLLSYFQKDFCPRRTLPAWSADLFIWRELLVSIIPLVWFESSERRQIADLINVKGEKWRNLYWPKFSYHQFRLTELLVASRLNKSAKTVIVQQFRAGNSVREALSAEMFTSSLLNLQNHCTTHIAGDLSFNWRFPLADARPR